MSWQHLQTFVWLRTRLLVNQWRKLGTLNAVLMTIIGVGALVMAVPLFLACLALGVFLIPKASPAHLLYAWDALVAVFLFFWSIGLITELQRTEPLALSKFLHLPVSVNGAFAINYVSSLLRLSLIVFVPIMTGFCLALIVVKGPQFVLALLLLLAFLLMITAVTYQFQGWLGALMSNPRRRRTVVVATTVIFVLMMQLPNLLNMFAPWAPQRRAEQSGKLAVELAKPEVAFHEGKIDAAEKQRRQKEIRENHDRAAHRARREQLARWEHGVRVANMVVPFGWLPYGVMSAAEGRVLPSILCLLGLSALGGASLRRAYRATVAQYQGQSSSRPSRRAAGVTTERTTVRKPTLLDARLIGFSEPVAAVALGNFCALLRAPEAKMALLTPLIMIPIFGAMVWNVGREIPELARPLIAIGGMEAVLLGLLGVTANQFGFDRDGFRAFVLSAASRRDILLGKNLGLAPVGLGLGALVLAFVQLLCPLRIDHLVAMVPQFVSMLLLFCPLANLTSIYAPLYVAAGALKPSNPSVSAVLLQLLMFLVLFPLTQALTLLPFGVEAALRLAGWSPAIPTGLLLALLQAAVLAVVYHWSLRWQGDLLQAREQRILERVTTRAA